MDKVIRKTIQNAKHDVANVTDLSFNLAQRYRDPTLCQRTLLVIFLGVLLTSVFRKFRKHRVPEPEIGASAHDRNGVGNKDVHVVKMNGPVKVEEIKVMVGENGSTELDVFLRRVIIFGLIMGYYFLCDYIKIFPAKERVYDRDQFLFLVFLLFLVACAFTIRPTPEKILNRNQTEEWKGWMQVMFVWYHYFAAKEWYNWIRIYIACYVWMTGFGNFSFFWVKKDFSLWRMLKMLFRLNFLVIFVVMVTDNQYMLYYICAMHTYWFFSVYFFMRVLSSWNTNRQKMALKFVVYFICNALIFDIPGAAPIVFYPLKCILGYKERKYPVMHEWAFRGGLDHWVCFVGMLCAYNYPNFERFINHIEEKAITTRDKYKKWTIKIVLVMSASVVGLLWYVTIMGRDKYAYNKLHPYTSSIPILVFIVLRNSFPVLRRYYVYMFEWLGKITLETYLSQLHIYLQANAKSRIGYIPGYSFLNFAFATIIYLAMSHTLFDLTIQFSNFLIPKDMNIVRRNCCIGVLVTGLACLIAFGAKYVM